MARSVTGSTRRQNVLLVALMIAAFTEIFESTMMAQALPHLMQVFDADAASASWVITAFLIEAGLSAPIGGRLGDIFGRRKVLLIVLVLAALGSLLSLVGGTLGFIIAGRALQGLTGAVIPLATALAKEHLAESRAPQGIAIIGTTSIGAGSSGFLLGGWLVDLGSWRTVFLFGLGMTVVALATTLALVPGPQADKDEPVRTGGARPDLIGGLLLAPGIAFALIAVTRIHTYGATSGQVLKPAGLAAVLLVLCVAWELRHPAPMLDLRLVLRGRVGLIMLATVCLGLGPFSVLNLVSPLLYQLPDHAPIGLGMGATMSGLLGGVAGLLTWALSPLAGKLVERRGGIHAFVLAVPMGFAPSLLLLAVYKSAVATVACLLMISIGMAFITSAVPNLLVTAVDDDRIGEVTGANYMVRYLFNGVGTAIGASILASSVVPGTVLPTLSAYRGTVAMLAGSWLLTLAVILILRKVMSRSDGKRMLGQANRLGTAS